MPTQAILTLIKEYNHSKKVFIKLISDDTKTQKYKVVIQERLLLTLNQIEGQLKTQTEINLALTDLEINSFNVEREWILNAKQENTTPIKEIPVSTQDTKKTVPFDGEVFSTPGFKNPYWCYEIESGTETFLFSQKRKLRTWNNGFWETIAVSREQKREIFKKWQKTLPQHPLKSQRPEYLDPAEWGYLTAEQQKWEQEQYGADRFKAVKTDYEHFIERNIMLGVVPCDEETKNTAWEFVWRCDLLPHERQRIRKQYFLRPEAKINEVSNKLPRGLTVLELFENLLEKKRVTIRPYEIDRDYKCMLIDKVKNNFLLLEQSLFAANVQLRVMHNCLSEFLKNLAEMTEKIGIIFYKEENAIIKEITELLEVTFLAKSRCRNMEAWSQLQAQKEAIIKYGNSGVSDVGSRVKTIVERIEQLEQLAVQPPLNHEKTKALVKEIGEAVGQYYGLKKIANDYLSAMNEAFFEMKASLLIEAPTTTTIPATYSVDYNMSFSQPISSNKDKEELVLKFKEKLAGLIGDCSFIEGNLSSLLGKYYLNFPDDNTALQCQAFFKQHQIPCATELASEAAGGLVKIPARIDFLLTKDRLLERLEAIPNAQDFHCK